jgi:hypothetical protein
MLRKEILQWWNWIALDFGELIENEAIKEFMNCSLRFIRPEQQQSSHRV